ncbi:hypothetical protein EX895_002176 [Sporisorium graminicola]|uniref:asparagine--tRNA ligase n=1 Tax=Sporisorium graminicola TaxID=280036 RepID=A0A4U7KW35_9BASI|nr:hypothetical protein EX895_002176 [Sporisorium graminicola]TKY88935.1 hypothetical protein EX895_002176 [Sporisorium graminicola]
MLARRTPRWSAARVPTRPAASAACPAASASYSAFNVSPHGTPRIRQYAASVRLLTSSSARALPRQLPRRSVQQDEEIDEASGTASANSNISDELSGTDPAIPWFLQTETVDAPPSSDSQPDFSTSTRSDTTASALAFSYIPLTPKVEEPNAIAKLKSHLLTGPSANLIARPSEDEDQLTPVTLIHPASLSKDPSSDAYGTNDWIVVVQVKSSAAGSVRRVALDVGRFLKHQPPPAMEAEFNLDEFLGPGPSAPRYTKSPSTPKPATPAASPRPKGMSRIEHELGKSLPDWAVHRIALQKKFPDGWRPPKILSREAQEGIRLLHSSDPEQFDVVELSNRFRVSTESIRRILRSGKWFVSGEVRSRQDRRAAERATEREASELAEIRRLQEEQSELVQDGESPVIEEVDFLEEEEDGDTPGIQPVRYEGLVMSASDASALGVTSKSKTGGKKGDGNWCLVDADWCMVHVMTEQARFTYDIEGIWRELEVGATAKSKPWEEASSSSSFGGPLAAAESRPSRPRTKRDMFGENLGNRTRNTGDGAGSAGAKFGSSSRKFSTSTIRRAAAASSSATTVVPESLEQLLSRVQRTFQSGSSDPVPVDVKGWLRSTRKQKSITFLELSDGSLSGSRSLQAVVRSSKDSPSSEIDRLAGLTVGTALHLTGHLKPGRGTKRGQEVELDATAVEVLSNCDLSYPLAAVQMQHNSTAVEQGGYSASLSERRNPHLLGRLPRYAAVARTRQRLEQGMGEYLTSNDFVKIACPILTSSDCEGAGEVFQVVADSDVRSAQALTSFWSGSSAYLTVSSQLHLEAAGLGLGRVWTCNPAFRAEGSATNRHLAEFWMLEVEMYFTDLKGILDATEGMIRAGIRSALKGAEDMELLADEDHLKMLRGVIDREGTWQRITYQQAFEMLSKAPRGAFDVDPHPDHGLASEHERWLASELGPVFVTHYPLDQKAFYMKRACSSPATPTLVECFDLLIPALGELVGGSVREHRPASLAQNLRDLAKNSGEKDAGGMDNLGWYLDDLKRFGGSVEHAGFGLGLERLLAWVSDTASVKDVVPFPRVKGPIRF